MEWVRWQAGNVIEIIKQIKTNGGGIGMTYLGFIMMEITIRELYIVN